MRESEFDQLDTKLLDSNGKVLHQIWFNFKNPISKEKNSPPEKLQSLRNKWIENNPNWTHVLWDDWMADWLVYKHYPHFWETYRAYPNPIQRVDTFRFCLLYRYGGVYADMDTICNRSIDPLIDSVDKEVMFSTWCVFNAIPDNYFMYSKPKADLWPKLIKGSINYGTHNPMVPYIVHTWTSSRFLQIRKEISKNKDKYGKFNKKDVYAVLEDKITEETMEKYVIHINVKDWVNTSDIVKLALFVLLIISIIVSAMILLIKSAKKLVKNAYNNSNKSAV